MVQLTLATFIALVACAACVPTSYETRDVDVQPTPEVNIAEPSVILPEPEPEPEPKPLFITSLVLSLLCSILGSWELGVIHQGARVYGLEPVTVGDVTIGLDDISGLLNLWGLSDLPAPDAGIPLVSGGLPGVGLGGRLIGYGLPGVVLVPYLVLVQPQPQPQPEQEIPIPYVSPDIVIHPSYENIVEPTY